MYKEKNMTNPILVTGAAGRVGAVGRTVTELLLKQGKAVRAMVRNEDQRAQALRDLGAEVVFGDLLDLDSMHRAIAGCERMYFGMSVSDAYLAATVNAAAVAKHHGVKAFINMSQTKELAAAGASVVVNYASSKEAADRIVAEINRKGGKAVAVKANMAKTADIENLFAETDKIFGRLDILVNNAGVYEFAPLDEVTEEHFHKHFDLNVLGLILASKEALRHFGSGGGSIINISSVASTAAMANTSVYSATKAAVDAVTKSLAKSLDRERFGSTRSIPVSPRPRASTE
jgi:NAD(P)-dependent dehydrogenase (short-subunit alcohol dehydrogenase family)